MALDPTPRESPSARFELRPVPAEGPTPSLADDVRAGFEKRPRELPSKYFYDDRGSTLFDRICETPEYYPTRTEAAILAHDADAVERRPILWLRRHPDLRTSPGRESRYSASPAPSGGGGTWRGYLGRIA